MGRLFFVLCRFPSDFVTERLVLHRWAAPAHTAALTALNAQPETVRFLNAGVPYTPAESERQSARFAEHWSTFGFGLWAIEAQGRIVGFTGVCHPRWFPAYAHEVEAGWRLRPVGLGPRLRDRGRVGPRSRPRSRTCELAHVSAFIDDGNDASVAVARRLGLSLDHLVADPDGTGTLHGLARTRAPLQRLNADGAVN